MALIFMIMIIMLMTRCFFHTGRLKEAGHLMTLVMIVMMMMMTMITQADSERQGM